MLRALVRVLSSRDKFLVDRDCSRSSPYATDLTVDQDPSSIGIFISKSDNSLENVIGTVNERFFGGVLIDILMYNHFYFLKR